MSISTVLPLTRIIHYCGSNCQYPLLALGVLLLVGLGVSRSANRSMNQSSSRNSERGVIEFSKRDSVG